jgi:hypothetical protein
MQLLAGTKVCIERHMRVVSSFFDSKHKPHQNIKYIMRRARALKETLNRFIG